MVAFKMRTSAWGFASLILLVGGFGVDAYNGYLLHDRHTPLFASVTASLLCAIVQVAAVICGVMAIRCSGRMYWLWTVLPAIYLALLCYFGEL